MTEKALLVINCGSSSLKFALYDLNSFQLQLSGLAEQLSSENSRIKYDFIQSNTSAEQNIPQLDHRQALLQLTDCLAERFPQLHIAGIGHRVVHGGEAFKSSVIINETVIQQIRHCIALAPLHNPANLTGISLCADLFPNVSQVAVFDTAFHQTIPEKAYLYPIPYQLYRESAIRRYGFHGSSHRFVTNATAEKIQKPKESLDIVTIHLGNGCSLCAVSGGNSIDTSMGLTPLEGLMMGTRSGNVDPGIFKYLESQGWTLSAIDSMLNKESGLLGISELSNDMRTLCQAADEGHRLAGVAIDMFCYRLAKQIASMAVCLPKLDALVFTGGIGENAANIREKTLRQLHLFGIQIDSQANISHGRSNDGKISLPDSLDVFVIPTNEELMIAQDTYDLIFQR